jgi:hypothetical protein
MIDTVFYIVGNGANILLLAWFLYASYQDRPLFHFWIGWAFLLLFFYEYELGREIMRWCGLAVHVGPYRMMYLRFLHCMTGMFYGEVINYAQHTFLAAQSRNRG